MNFDKNTGIIEMFMESLGKEDEGTFTFQLQDGKATNQSSLVLIGDGTSKSPYTRTYMYLIYRVCTNDSISFPSVFKQLQKESEFQRKEWHRKQGTSISTGILFLKIHVNKYIVCNVKLYVEKVSNFLVGV